VNETLSPRRKSARVGFGTLGAAGGAGAGFTPGCGGSIAAYGSFHWALTSVSCNVR
jgi:hypothetical protein